MIAGSIPAAPGALRDAFLEALDAGEHARVLALAHYLTQSMSALPSVTCIALDLPARSTYGTAARGLNGRESARGPA
jgi:hypothetical protein